MMEDDTPNLKNSAILSPADDNISVKKSKIEVAPLKRRDPNEDIPLLRDENPNLKKSAMLTPADDNVSVKKSKIEVAPPKR